MAMGQAVTFLLGVVTGATGIILIVAGIVFIMAIYGFRKLTQDGDRLF